MELTREQYEELCRRVGRAVIAMHLTGEAWFNAHSKREQAQDMCAFRNERVPKWLQTVMTGELEAITRNYTDAAAGHFRIVDPNP